jgi:hypothetical protein
MKATASQPPGVKWGKAAKKSFSGSDQREKPDPPRA